MGICQLYQAGGFCYKKYPEDRNTIEPEKFLTSLAVEIKNRYYLV